MKRFGYGLMLWRGLSVSLPVHAAAVDSYRFLHVTIETPWYIFLFLLLCVFSPIVLMVILMWRSAISKNHPDDHPDPPSAPE